MKNYHYYLKQELYSTTSSRFSDVIWHPEQPMTIYLVEESESIVFHRADDRLSPGQAIRLGHLRRPSPHAKRYRLGSCRRWKQSSNNPIPNSEHPATNVILHHRTSSNTNPRSYVR